MGSFDSFRKAVGAIKDSTTVQLVKLNSDFKVFCTFSAHFCRNFVKMHVILHACIHIFYIFVNVDEIIMLTI